MGLLGCADGIVVGQPWGWDFTRILAKGECSVKRGASGKSRPPVSDFQGDGRVSEETVSVGWGLRPLHRASSRWSGSLDLGRKGPATLRTDDQNLGRYLLPCLENSIRPRTVSFSDHVCLLCTSERSYWRWGWGEPSPFITKDPGAVRRRPLLLLRTARQMPCGLRWGRSGSGAARGGHREGTQRGAERRPASPSSPS